MTLHQRSTIVPLAQMITVYPPLTENEQKAERERQLALLHAQMQSCQQCVTAGYLQRAATVAGFRGRIGDQLMLIGQAPGHLSVERGFPFAGPGGKVLDVWLQRAGYPAGALRSQVYISALTKCDPGKNLRGGGDRKPSPAELALCRPFLLRELELLRPRGILLVGGIAIEAFLGSQRLSDIVGKSFEQNDVKLLPLPHPSGVSRWLNRAEHQQLVTQALDILAGWRREWVGETVPPINNILDEEQ